MIGLTTGALINIVLDPILIFGFNMGISGAALATIISQFVSFCLLYWGIRRAGNVLIRFRNFRPSRYFYKMIVNGGLPSLCRQSISGIAMICLNTAARPTVMPQSRLWRLYQGSPISRIPYFLVSARDFQPVCGFNYGAKLYGRVKKGFWFCVKIGTVFLLILATVEFAAAPVFDTAVQKGRWAGIGNRCQSAAAPVPYIRPQRLGHDQQYDDADYGKDVPRFFYGSVETGRIPDPGRAADAAFNRNFRNSDCAAAGRRHFFSCMSGAADQPSARA